MKFPFYATPLPAYTKTMLCYTTVFYKLFANLCLRRRQGHYFSKRVKMYPFQYLRLVFLNGKLVVFLWLRNCKQPQSKLNLQQLLLHRRLILQGCKLIPLPLLLQNTGLPKSFNCQLYERGENILKHLPAAPLFKFFFTTAKVL